MSSVRVPSRSRLAGPAFLALVSVGGPAAAQQPPAARTRTLQVTEEAGLARIGWPLEATVGFDAAAVKDAKDLRLFLVDGSRKVPVAFQVLEVEGAGVSPPALPPQMFVRLVFAADAPANGTATYVISAEGDAGTPAKTLAVTGEGVGKTIDTGPAVFELHPGSGQLATFSPRQVNRDRLVFIQDPKNGPMAIHWNPDVWTPPAPWGHTSDWRTGRRCDAASPAAEATPALDETTRPFLYRDWNGPLAYRLTRWGRMPSVPAVDVSVTYTFYAGAPFISVRSLMEFREDATANAVRNAELVFSRHQFDTGVWMTNDGRLHTAPCYDYDDKDKSFHTVTMAPPDAPCVGLANERKGYGIAMVPLGLTSVNKFSGEAGDGQAHFYIRDYDEHGKGSPNNFVYLVRWLVGGQTFNPTRIRAGSVYAEHSAIVVFALKAGEGAARYDDLVRWQKMLSIPPVVVVK